MTASPELLADLKRDEGCRLRAYVDTLGIWTVGYGHAHVQPGTVWTQAQADAQLKADADRHCAELVAALPWVARLDPVRRDVLANMAFNMGVPGLLAFKNTLASIEAGRFTDAALRMLASKWAGQIGNRAHRLADMMRTGRHT
jgi:lysozyme